MAEYVNDETTDISLDSYSTGGVLMHVGNYVMPSGEWECADNCPHPDHDEDGD